MPYRGIDDLPDRIRRHLPAHAQEIFVAAFNRAWADRAGEAGQEETAFRIAWAAVKRRYRRQGEVWVVRDR